MGYGELVAEVSVVYTFHDIFKRGEYKGERCAQVMAYVGEEAELHIVDFMLLIGLLLYLQEFVLLCLAVAHVGFYEQNHSYEHKSIYYVGYPRAVKRRSYHYAQFGCVLSDKSVVIDGLDFQRICSGTEVGVREVVVGGVCPVGVEAFKHVHIAVLFEFAIVH